MQFCVFSVLFSSSWKLQSSCKSAVSMHIPFSARAIFYSVKDCWGHLPHVKISKASAHLTDLEPSHSYTGLLSEPRIFSSLPWNRGLCEVSSVEVALSTPCCLFIPPCFPRPRRILLPLFTYSSLHSTYHQVLTLLITSMTSRVMILIWATMINPFYQTSSTIIQVQISLSYLPAYTASMSSHWLTSYQGLWDPCMPHLFSPISINSREFINPIIKVLSGPSMLAAFPTTKTLYMPFPLLKHFFNHSTCVFTLYSSISPQLKAVFNLEGSLPKFSSWTRSRPSFITLLLRFHTFHFYIFLGYFKANLNSSLF